MAGLRQPWQQQPHSSDSNPPVPPQKLLTEGHLYSHVVELEDVVVTTALFLPSILVWVMMVRAGISGLSPQSGEMFNWGANYGPTTLSGQYWRWFTATILHFGFMHLLMNGVALYRVAPMVCALLGPWRTTLIYVGSGLFGSVCTTIFSHMAISAGASGAVLGMFGAFFPAVLNSDYRKMGMGAVASLALFVGIVLMNGLTNPNIGNAAHIGGFLFGFGASWLFRYRDLPSSEKLVAGLLAASMVMVATLLPADVDPIRLGLQYDAKFLPLLDRINKAYDDYKPGTMPDAQIGKDLADARPVIDETLEKFLTLYEAARSKQAKVQTAAIAAGVVSNRLSVVKLETTLKAALEINSIEEAMKTATGSTAIESLLKLTQLINDVQRARGQVQSDFDLLRKISDEQSLGTAQILDNSKGTKHLESLAGLEETLKAFAPVVIGTYWNVANKAFHDSMGLVTNMKGDIEPSQLDAASRSAADAARDIATVLEFVESHVEWQQTIAQNPKLASMPASLALYRANLNFLSTNFSFLSYWKSRALQPVKPEDVARFRTEMVNSLTLTRNEYHQKVLAPALERAAVSGKKEQIAEVANFTAMILTTASAECVAVLMTKGRVPAWNSESPGQCPGIDFDRVIAQANSPAAQQYPNLLALDELAPEALASYRESLAGGKFTDLSNLSASDKKEFVAGKVSATFLSLKTSERKNNSVVVEVNGRPAGSIDQRDPNAKISFVYRPGKPNTLKFTFVQTDGGSSRQFFRAPDGKVIGGEVRTGDHMLWKGIIQ